MFDFLSLFKKKRGLPSLLRGALCTTIEGKASLYVGGRSCQPICGIFSKPPKKRGKRLLRGKDRIRSSSQKNEIDHLEKKEERYRFSREGKKSSIWWPTRQGGSRTCGRGGRRGPGIFPQRRCHLLPVNRQMKGWQRGLNTSKKKKRETQTFK